MRVILLSILILAPSLRADEPLPPPEKHTIVSLNGLYRADLDPDAYHTIVYDSQHQELWRMEGWFRNAWLSDDGQYMVIGYDGGNLIPTKTGSTPLIHFYHRGKPITSKTVSDLIVNLQNLQETASHYHWGAFLGITSDGRFGVETVEGKRIYFHIATGMRTAE